MANYYWVGATASAGISRYDFNTPSNWQTAYWNSQATGASFGWAFQTSSYSPGVGDNVFVGTSNVGTLPVAKSPLLFGGVSGNVGYAQWSNSAGSTGTTNTSSLNSITIDINTAKYPFSYFGGGLTGTVYDWVILQGLTNSDFSGATGQRAVQPMKLKVSQNYFINTNPSALVDIVNIKSISVAVGTTATNIVNTTVNVNGNGYVRFSGGSVSRINNNSTGFLYVSGITCGDLYTVPSAVYVNRDAIFSNVYVQGQYKSPIWFGGSLDTQSVLSDLGFSGSVTGSNAAANDSGIIISPINGWWNGGGLTSSPIFYFGTVGVTAATSFCKKIVVDSTPGLSGTTGAISDAVKWNLVFAGGASATSVETNAATISAYDYIDPTSVVRIGTLGMGSGSVLDFAKNAQFNNWFFGAVTGGQIQGGIVFRDETPIMKGSAGIRLYNTQVAFNRFDTYTGKVTNTSATNPGNEIA